MTSSVLILGGTAEAIKHTQELIAENIDQRIIYSLAGRTKTPQKLDCEIRIGGFGGVEGLIKFISENRVEKVIDATHPYALQITKNAKQAALKTNIKYAEILRPKWKEQEGDNWINVSSTAKAAKIIPQNSRVFLGLGRQHIDVFTARKDCHFVMRMVDKPEAELNFSAYEVLVGTPSASIEEECSLLKKHKIQILVSRNSGGEQSYRKIAAARQLGIPVIMIERPS